MSSWKQTTNYIYHEKQESMLCGQHCLNNLMQGPYFNAVELSNIALELDAKERALVGRSLEYHSANVDDSGNFSIQVLKSALERHNIRLEPWHQRAGEAAKDPSQEKAFVVNRSSHWYTVRKLHSEWWNLNSSLDLPEPISSFYMTAFFSGLKADGYTIFVASGPGLIDKRDPNSVEYLPKSSTGVWYEEKQLKNLIDNGGSRSAASAHPVEPEKKFQAYEGKAHRLDGRNETSSQGEDLLAQLQGAETDEELQLALAISASLQQEQTQKKDPTKEEIRAKRLAALERKG